MIVEWKLEAQQGRSLKASRETAETRIQAYFDLDGSGQCQLDTGIGFFDHLLHAFAFHGRFDLQLNCQGDLDTGGHHLVEDTGLVLGRCVREALDSGHAVNRFASRSVPMDDALVRAAVDAGGRPFYRRGGQLPVRSWGLFHTDLLDEFWRAFCQQGGITLHLDLLAGENAHHLLEAAFKAVGLAAWQASRTGRYQQSASTKDGEQQ